MDSGPPPRPVAEGREAVNAGLRRRYISGISVRKLFGQFDYDLSAKADQPANLSSIILFYGDNGTGKTTILSLIFHLLSAGNNRGHRNFIARVPFSRFEVSFSDGVRVAAFRSGDLIGRYQMSAESDGATVRAIFDPGKDSPGKFGTEREEDDFLSFLKSLEESLYLLPADRFIVSDLLPRFGLEDFNADALIDPISRLRRYVDFGNELRGQLLLRAINLATDWVRRKAFDATTRGTDDANTIYAHVLKTILESSASLLQKEPSAGHYPELTSALETLARRSAEYAKFKFTSPLQIDDIKGVLSRPVDATAPIIERVIQSYIQGTTARLKALENLHSVVTSLVNSLNSFFRWKKVAFDLENGLTIFTEGGSRINPIRLSSGEQHLVLMFCHTIISRDRQSIFFIDEPELSLNIKWQRKLIDVLLELARDSAVQFVFATHSIEIAHEHLDKVAELEPRVAGEPDIIGGNELSGPADNS